jgi:Uma2 family endonuclease
LPGGWQPPQAAPVPAIVPDVAVEVISKRNRVGEVARKRGEYFRAGVKLVWEINRKKRSAKAYKSLTEMETVSIDGILDAGDVMPGFQLSLRAIFDRAERNC